MWEQTANNHLHYFKSLEANIITKSLPASTSVMKANPSKDLTIAKMAEWQHRGNTPQVVFNKFELKPMQKAILNCLQVTDVIANLPTGFGKSLLFQYPASLQKINQKCILVVVPLKALLWDTIREARQLGIAAEEIDYGVINGYYRDGTLPQMLVTTPEKIFATENTFYFIESLHKDNQLRLLVIDQCHCVSEWGHDFRPAYLRLQELKQALPGVRLLAISATIAPETRVDLAQRLGLHQGNYFQASYHRPNLYYCVVRSKSKAEVAQDIYNYLEQNKLVGEPGIIYCQTITNAEQVAKTLSQLMNVGLFHSKLSQKLRKQTYDGFMEGKIKTIIGTICFGMGINKKDIRYVINIGVSKSPENYYQESGRAGRDGKQAHCVSMAFPGQMNSLTFLISKSGGSNKLKSHQLYKLQEMGEYIEQEFECRRQVLFKKLGENFDARNCNRGCDVCRKDGSDVKLVRIDYFAAVNKIVEQLQLSKLKFTKKQLMAYLKGKNVSSARGRRTREMELGLSIKGIFQKLPQDIIELVVKTMIHKNLLVQVPVKSKYMILYFKAATKAATKSFKQFYITVQQPVQAQRTEPKDNKGDKFAKFLNKKTATSTSLQEAQSKKIQETKFEPLQQADVVKEKQDYNLFFTQLFGSEVMDPKVEKSAYYFEEQQSQDSKIQKQPQQIIDINEDQEQQPVYFELDRSPSKKQEKENSQTLAVLVAKYRQKRESLRESLKRFIPKQKPNPSEII